MKSSLWLPPEWSKKAVWYQIFPERFRNGDPANDPRIGDLSGAYPGNNDLAWQLHPWNSDWYQRQPWERNQRDIWYNIHRRRYGGDLQGILDKLDYLQDLGVNAIYLNPVFDSPSAHKYDSASYHHIDPNFGPDPDGDRKLIQSEIPDDPSSWVWTSADRLMRSLISELHRRKMRIIFDGVFNHVGYNHWAFKDLRKSQKNSKYGDWFSVNAWDDTASGSSFDYKCWYGVRELPEWKQDENGLVEGPKKYIFDCTRRWMDPDGNGDSSKGIDGWRLDVAFLIRHQFWKEWAALVREINSLAYLTAEIIDTVEANKPYLEGDEFHAVMNYNFAFACSDFFFDKKGISATCFDELLRKLRDAYHPETAYAMMNLFGSHDTNRLASHIVNGFPDYRDWSKYFDESLGRNRNYNVRKPNADEIRLQELFLIMQMTYVGAPMIFYGDEAGMWGANDPCCRKPMLWDDIEYFDEVFLPDDTKRAKPDPVKFNRELFSCYKKLIGIRNSHPALQIGKYETIVIDDEHEIFGFSRNLGREELLIFLNKSLDSQIIRVKTLSKGPFIDLLDEKGLFQVVNGEILLEIPACGGRIIMQR
ncbi:MAG: glycoside hydrolase family 13 protein [Candidatus Wallbacteria bacterium]|nr:glycoside hydrolase family 13 protein [Candidatus Wallbacteria bacterium]